MRTIAAVPAVPLLAGCACGLLIADRSCLPVIVLSATAVVIASITAALWSVRSGAQWPLILAVAIGFFAGGVRLASIAWQHAWRTPLRADFARLAAEARRDAGANGRRMPVDDEATAMLVGVLDADAVVSANGVALAVRVERLVEEDRSGGLVGRGGRHASACGDAQRMAGPHCGKVLLTVMGSLALDRVDEWRAGRRVRVPAQLRRPARYLDPGVPDHEKALARRGVTLVGTVKSGALVEIVGCGSPWSEALASFRAFARRAIRDAVARWDSRSGAIVAAIVIGDRSALDDDVQVRLQEAGTYHVIAISGGNIAILAGLMVTAFKVAGWFGRGAMAAAIALLAAYADFVGGGASVSRATLMAILYFGARVFDLRTPPLNALAVAAAVLAAADPLSIADPAFLLTFGATLAILVIVPAWHARSLPAAAAVLTTMLAASAAAELALFPIAAAFFSRVTMAGLALNFVAIPLMSVAQVAGMAVVPIAAMSGRLAAGVGWVAHLGAFGLVASSELVRLVPSVAWRVAPPPPSIVGLYYGSSALAWFMWRRVRAVGTEASRRSRIAVYVAALGTVFTGWWIAVDPRTFAAAGDGRLRVTFIDVGQGDAAFLVFPNGSTMLVDSGGLGFSSSFDLGDRVVAPVIRRLGYARLERLVLTHGDPDHIGGAPAIIEEFRPREVWEGIPVPRSNALTALRLQVQRQGAWWANVHQSDRVAIDGVDVLARHPERESWERQRVRNDDSLVLELRWREVSIVLTGDIGRLAEQRILPAFTPANIRILKVPHHGSLTSSSPAFVNALKPTIAVISAGRGNHYGHPAPEVLQRYEAVGAQVFRTDLDGAVTLETDGFSVSVSTFAAHDF